MANRCGKGVRQHGVLSYSIRGNWRLLSHRQLLCSPGGNEVSTKSKQCWTHLVHGKEGGGGFFRILGEMTLCSLQKLFSHDICVPRKCWNFLSSLHANVIGQKRRHVQEFTLLSIIPGLGMVDQLVIDPMHTADAGVFKMFLEELLNIPT